MMNLKERAKRLKVDIPTIYLALKDHETPFFAKVLASITIVYALSPIDIIPDFIPIIGYLDDVILLPLLIMLTLRFIPKDIYEAKRMQAEHLWVNGKPKKWIYALPIVCIWCLCIGLLIKWLWF